MKINQSEETAYLKLAKQSIRTNLEREVSPLLDNYIDKATARLLDTLTESTANIQLDIEKELGR